MKYLFLVLFLISPPLLAAPPELRFHLHEEPYSIDPSTFRGMSGAFLFHNIFRGLYAYHSKKGLQPEGAETCDFKNDLLVQCKLSPSHKWSNGERVTAQQYVQTFRRLAHPKTKTLQTELLLTIKNSEDVLSGQLPPEKLGVKAIGPYLLQFELAKKDYEFLYKLINPTLAPLYSLSLPSREKAAQLISTGPYKIKSWDVGKQVTLVKNPFYTKGNPTRPDVVAYFIEEDATAATLYDSGQMNFLRRVPISEIPFYQKSKDFVQVGVARNDYIGFGPELKPYPKLRQALTLALDYKGFATLLHAKGTPGCPSIPPNLMVKPPCYELSLKKAKALFAQLPAEVKNKRWTLTFSKSGGESIKKSMEWIQFQWKKHLGFNVDLIPMELGMYYQSLRLTPPAIFRKGVSMDRPTCLAAIEVFSKDNRENYVRFNNDKFESLLKKLNSPLSPKQKKQLCQQGVQFIMDEYTLIPLGEIHFSMRIKDSVKGWDINELNQLDLSHLEVLTFNK